MTGKRDDVALPHQPFIDTDHSSSTISTHGQSPTPRSPPQVDPQHPQDHADDGVDLPPRGSRRPWTAPLAATAYTRRITALVADLARSGLEVELIRCWSRGEKSRRASLLVLTGNRGLCGGYNASVLRLAYARWTT